LVLLGAVAAIWSTAFLFTRVALEELTHATLVAARIGVAALAFGERVDGAGLGLILIGMAAARSDTPIEAEAHRRTLPAEQVRATA
jgi:hypothetical protein